MYFWLSLCSDANLTQYKQLYWRINSLIKGIVLIPYRCHFRIIKRCFWKCPKSRSLIVQSTEWCWNPSHKRTNSWLLSIYEYLINDYQSRRGENLWMRWWNKNFAKANWYSSFLSCICCLTWCSKPYSKLYSRKMLWNYYLWIRRRCDTWGLIKDGKSESNTNGSKILALQRPLQLCYSLILSLWSVFSTISPHINFQKILRWCDIWFKGTWGQNIYVLWRIQRYSYISFEICFYVSWQCNEQPKKLYWISYSSTSG